MFPPEFWSSFSAIVLDISLEYLFSCSSIIHMHDMTKPTQSLYVDALYYVNVSIELLQLSAVSNMVLIEMFNWAEGHGCLFCP